MKRLKGPELKMPEVGVPSFLADVYYDLRDRRLLPLVALVAVAIAAVPFLLGGSDEPLPAQTPEEAAEAARLQIEDDSSLTVVEAKPGLRDYRKRLRGRTPTDPFIQRYTGIPERAQLTSEAVISTTDVSGGSVDVSAGESGDPVSSPPSSAPAPGSGHGQGGTGTKPGKTGGDQPDSLDGKRLFGFRPDVLFGVAGSGQLTLHDDLPLGSLLPEQNAVVLFVGVTQNGERALFSVGPEIIVRGDGGCVGGDENCRFLSMREGDAVDLLTSLTGPSYRLKVESIDFVELDLPPKSERASGSRAEGPRQGLAPGLPQNFSN
jgi:hypothetical protein